MRCLEMRCLEMLYLGMLYLGIFYFSLSLQTRVFFVNFLIGGCGSGACKWRAYFPAFVSGFYCKKQEK